MIQTWVTDISPLMDQQCYQEYYLRVPKFRQEKADHLKEQREKAQSIGVWLLYESMKKEYHLSEDAPCSFSHSGDDVLCSISTQWQNPLLLGCDIQLKGDVRENVAKRFFCPSEYDQIFMENEEADKQDLFYRYWVLKESFLKATGKGLALNMQSFEFHLGEPPVMVRQPQEFPQHFSFLEKATKDGDYRIAVCATEADIEPIQEVEAWR